MMHDDSQEFYSPYYARDANKDGLDILSSLAVAAETEDFKVDGVFCIATNNDLQDQDIDTLVTTREDLRMSAVRFHGVYSFNRDEAERGEEEWHLYVRRAERLRPENSKGAFSELNVVRVEAASARSDQVAITRHCLGEGDVIAQPLRLSAEHTHTGVTLAKGAAMMGESKEHLSNAFPGNSFVHVPSGLLSKSVLEIPETAEECVKEFVSVATKKFFRFLPRRNGQRALFGSTRVSQRGIAYRSAPHDNMCMDADISDVIEALTDVPY